MLVQARCSPSLRRQVHTAAERAHASTEVADTDIAPIQKFSCRKYMCNGRDRGSPIDLVWDTQVTRAVKACWCEWIYDLAGSKLTIMFLEDAGGSIAAATRVVEKQDGRGDAGTLGKVGPRIPRNSDGTMAQER